MIRGDDVQFPVFVEVYQIQAARVELDCCAHGERRPGGAIEAAFAVTQENIYGVPVAVRYAKVEDFVSVDIPQLDVSRHVAQVDLTAGGGGKPPCSVANPRCQQPLQQMTGHQIEPAIVIDIRERYLTGPFPMTTGEPGAGMN